MAVTSAQVAVATTPALLTATASTDGDFTSDLLLTNTGAAAVFVGGPAVSTTTGYSLAAGASLTVRGLSSGEQVFAVAAAAGTVHVLRVGV